ncbi:cupin domain-containing protein [Celerinatantimonas yamalensis]|uniref:Cupin domain-containing protein n=1 Tax=Celerinatantimonas yamalensis TaxID=559956 RepID=A0ABW9G0Z1_9GAMM
MIVFKYERGEKTDHSHPVEQMGYVLSGKASLFIEDQEYSLKVGDAYYIPGGARHGFNVNSEEGLELIEVYTPPKPENTY